MTRILFVSIAVLVLLGLPMPPTWASPPVVDAGAAQVVALPATDLTLFGHVTDTVPFTSQWTQVSGPATATFSASWSLFTTVTYSATGTYVFKLTATDSTSSASAQVQVTVNAASSQTAYYVAPTYTGSTQDGSAAHPWVSLADGDSDYAAKWTTINTALATNPVIVYFAARQPGADVSETMPGQLWVNRTDTSTHRLTLDGMSLYSTSDSVPNWVAYTGSKKFKVTMTSGCCVAIGWDDNVKRNDITIRGFEVTGSGARVVWGGSRTVVEHLWVHDITTLGATVTHSAAVGDPPDCPDLGKVTGITVRKNTIDHGIGEAIYIAGNYLLTSDGGCPAYGNTHKDILIEGNQVTDAGINGDEGDGLDLKAGLINVTVRGNTFSNSHNSSEGVVNWQGTFNSVTENYLIENNTIAGATGAGSAGIGGANSHTVTIRNNLIYNMTAAGITLCSATTFPGDTVNLYNNTVYGNTGGGVSVCNLNGLDARDNLIFGNGTGNQITNGGGANTNITGDYNLLAPAGSDFTEGSHSIIQTSTTGIVVNAANGDFHLVVGSPAIGHGTNLSATGFTTDIAGTVRSSGATWDIGAYAYP